MKKLLKSLKSFLSDLEKTIYNWTICFLCVALFKCHFPLPSRETRIATFFLIGQINQKMT